MVKNILTNLLVWLAICVSQSTAFTVAPPVAATYHLASSPLHMAKAEGMTPEEQAIALEKATKAMTAFTNKYLENTSTKLCSDKSVPAVVIQGLAEHKVTLGAPLCPW